MIADILCFYLLLVLLCIPWQLQRLEKSGFRDLSPELQVEQILDFWFFMIFVPMATFLCFVILIFTNKDRPQEYIKIFMLIAFLGWGLNQNKEEPQDE